jgi:hypothetical protein
VKFVVITNLTFQGNTYENVQLISSEAYETRLYLMNVLIQDNVCSNKKEPNRLSKYFIKFDSTVINQVSVLNNKFCPGIIFTNSLSSTSNETNMTFTNMKIRNNIFQDIYSSVLIGLSKSSVVDPILRIVFKDVEIVNNTATSNGQALESVVYMVYLNNFINFQVNGLEYRDNMNLSFIQIENS